jgi:hypothetical protein
MIGVCSAHTSNPILLTYWRILSLGIMMESTLRLPKSIPFHRWAGAAFIVGNVLFIVNKLNEMSRLFLSRPMPDVISGQTPLVIFIGQLPLVIGYLGFYQYYASRLARSGRIALRLFSGGGILIAIGHVAFMTALEQYLHAAVRPYFEMVFALVLIGMLFMLTGLVWFGILTLRQPVLAAWQWLPLATGLMGVIGFLGFGGEQITATFLFFRTLFALGLIGLGLTLWLEKDAQGELVR